MWYCIYDTTSDKKWVYKWCQQRDATLISDGINSYALLWHVYFKFYYKEGNQGDEIDQSDEGYMRGDQGDLKRTVNILEDQHFYKIYFYNKMCKNPNICSWKAIKLSWENVADGKKEDSIENPRGLKKSCVIAIG